MSPETAKKRGRGSTVHTVLPYMFDHLDEAEPTERRVVAGEDHHDGPALQAGHAPGLATASQLRGLLGHRVEKFVLQHNKTIIGKITSLALGQNRQVPSQSVFSVNYLFSREEK